MFGFFTDCAAAAGTRVTFRGLVPGFALLALSLPAYSQAPRLAASLGEDAAPAASSIPDQGIGLTDGGGAWMEGYAALTGQLAPGVDLDALDIAGPSRIYFSLDADAEIGGSRFADHDVILWTGGSAFAKALDGQAAGLPRSANIDALDVISEFPALSISLSLATDCRLTVGGVPDVEIADEDVVRFEQGVGFLFVDFDGTAEGVAGSADLDSFSRTAAGNFAISFDSAGRIDGAFVSGGSDLVYDDADLIEWNPGAGLFEPLLHFDSFAGLIPASADTDAVAADLSVLEPTATPSPQPTATPSPEPTATPSPDPTATPSPEPTATPSPDPTATPSPEPTATPSPDPTATPSPEPTATPSPEPSATPSPEPTATPSPEPTATASPEPTATASPSASPYPCCPGDANHSGGFVDAHDFISVQANLGSEPGVGGIGDANCSGGFVDALDFIEVQANFGRDCG